MALSKGKVESGIKYVKGNFLPGRRFTDVVDLNTQGVTWCHEAGDRIHGTTGEKPNERLKEERLRPLPPPEAVVRYLTDERRVSRDGFVSYEGAYYGIPWAFSGKHVGVVDLGFSVEVKHQGKRVALFPKARTRGARQSVDGQYRDIPLNNPPLPHTALAVRVREPVVEARPLSVYSTIAGGDGK